jgi:hypothetical protein
MGILPLGRIAGRDHYYARNNFASPIGYTGRRTKLAGARRLPLVVAERLAERMSASELTV